MWIEAHQELRNHPKILRLARTLKIGKPQAIGHLLLLWWWTLDYAPSGDVSAFAPSELASAAEWMRDANAFEEALTDAGWLDLDRKIHNWKSYAGRLIARREADKQRKQKERGADPPTETGSNGCPTDVHGTGVGSPALPNPTEPEPDLTAIAKSAPTRARMPTKEEVLAWASMDNCPAELAEIFWNHYDSIGWVDAGGNSILNARSRLAKWSCESRVRQAREKDKGADSRGFWQITKELELVQRELKKLWESRLESAHGWTINPPEKMQRYRDLKKRERQLKTELNL